jgi:hypothetical protein
VRWPRPDPIGLLGLVVLGLAAPRAARAADAEASPAPASPSPGEMAVSPAAHKKGWVDFVATGFLGDGLRFTNPYRLSTVLGSGDQSLSRTAFYADVGAALLFGDPARFAQGGALRVSKSMEGVSQTVVTPSYLALHRWGAWGVYGRGGLPIVAAPDVTWGLEAAVGGLWFARSGIGVAAEAVGDLFYGAGTRDTGAVKYPVLSAQAGLWLSWEVLP